MRCKMIPIFLATCVFWACSSPSQNPEEGGNLFGETLDLEVKKFTLKNGLRLLVYENHLLPIAAYFTFVNTGGRHESVREGTTGSSHFLEHMLFKTTEKYPEPGTINELFTKMGARVNAYTSIDSTVYHEQIPVEKLDKLIEINADRMKNLTILPAQFESERGVVREERKLRLENSPSGKLYYTAMQDVFKRTPYGGSVIGSIKDLERLTPKTLLKFYKNFYTPDNMVIAIAGDVDADAVYQKISRAYGDMSPASPAIQAYRKKIDSPALYRHRARYGREVKVHGTNPTPMFTLVYKGDAMGTERSYVLQVLMGILTSGKSSWFHQRYVASSRPMLQDIHGGSYGLKYNGTVNIGGKLLSGVSLKKVKKRLIADTLRVCDRGIDERSLQKARNQLMNRYYNVIRTNRGMAHFLGKNEMFMGDYAHYKKEIAAYNKITVKQLKRVCRETFRKNRHIFFSIWNKHPKKRGR